MVSGVLEKIHEDLGHRSQNKIMAAVKRIYWW